VLQYGDKGRLLLNYKEPIEGSKSVYNIVKTIRSAWLPLQDIELIIKGSSLDNIYEAMAGQILGFGTITSDDTKRIIALQDEIAKKQRAAEALQKKVRTERQFSRQMEYNTEARVLKQEIKKLQEELKQFDRK
jgi:predicted RNase H-like nuclease (RuvC/YqgF family)